VLLCTEVAHFLASIAKAKDAICNLVVMSVFLFVCNQNALNGWAEPIGHSGQLQ